LAVDYYISAITRYYVIVYYYSYHMLLFSDTTLRIAYTEHWEPVNQVNTNQ